jgi:Family of unknown function (DUF6069)
MTEASPGTGSPSRTALPSGPVWRAGLLAALAAALANAVAWVLLQPVLGLGLQVPVTPGSSEFEELPLALVIGFTAFSGLLGVVVLWLLTRRGPSGVRLWSVLAGAVGVLSGVSPLSLDVSLGRRLGLYVFHLVAAAVMIAVVRQQLGTRQG